jgi:hypothetical protein
VEFSHLPYSPDCASQILSVLKCENGLPRGRRFQDIRDTKKTTTKLNAISVDVSSVQLLETHEKCATVKITLTENETIFLFLCVCVIIDRGLELYCLTL